MTDETRRLMRPERLGNLAGGSGRISDEEATRLNLIRSNSRKLNQMGKRSTPQERKGGKRNETEVNRTLRDWVTKGKSRDASLSSWKDETTDWYDAFDALDYFDIDPDEKTYYVDKES
jgi:hypothetical protein